MTQSTFARLACFSFLSVLTSVTPAHAQAPDPAAQADQMFRSLDADGDGRITIAEGGPQSRTIKQQIFGMAGKGINDSLSRAEFQEVFNRFRAGNGGGRPQPGAAPPGANPSGTGRRIPSSAQPRATASGTRPGAGTQAVDPNVPQIWRGFIVQGRGENPNENQMEIELTISGNQIRGRQVGRGPGGGGGGPPGGLGTGNFVMDAQAGTLDVTQTEGQNAGKHYPGIFQIEGDTLRWCVSNSERRRPQQLATVGASAYLMILRRQAAAPPQQ
jgi:uncharacterized protein (TIGR03067 family)